MSPPGILVTRPRPDAERTAARLEALALRPVIAPMLAPRFTGAPLPDAGAFAAVVATSANAVRALADHRAGRGFIDLPLFAVGDHTANVARQAGFEAIRIAEGTLDALVKMISENRPDGPLFHPAARHRSGDLAGLLAPRGIEVETRVLYEMEAAKRFPHGVLESLMDGDVAGAVFFSRRTAQVFAGLLEGIDFLPVKTRLYCMCLSENVAEPLVQARFVSIGLADYPSHEAMMALALAFARDQISP